MYGKSGSTSVESLNLRYLKKKKCFPTIHCIPPWFVGMLASFYKIKLQLFYALFWFLFFWIFYFGMQRLISNLFGGIQSVHIIVALGLITILLSPFCGFFIVLLLWSHMYADLYLALSAFHLSTINYSVCWFNKVLFNRYFIAPTYTLSF